MADKVTLPEDQESFKLNEVCKLANVQPYMLRFWGTEFDQLEAEKSGTGQRLYTRDQVLLILEIRRLLFDEGLTIAGARKRVTALQEEGKLPDPEVPKTTSKKKKAAEPEPADEPAEEAAEEAAPAEDEPPAEVDKEPPADVQPLLATLEDVRKEVAKIVAELRE